MLLARIRLLIATLWAGSLWTVGYLVAPTLFATLDDKMLAGTIAGRIFRVEAWLSVLCAVALVLLVRFLTNDEARRAGRQLTWLAIAMLGCTLIGYFGLQPFMAALRESAGLGGVMNSEAKMQFGLLHGVSSGFYLAQSLLAVVLVLKTR
jgi:hypothetical protein